MTKLYSKHNLDFIVAEISKSYCAIIKRQQKKIHLLEQENEQLKKMISQEVALSETEEDSLDMEKVLHPDSAITLEGLCKDMGLME